ncbi:aspartate aminotransferase family protein [Flavihumibacter sp. CACIAM 22H1]|uniref:aspartate aminotransferase family protein n=1 Tax=Flavihumibacter sp. CACIAM 22H1 TaxID=1812911 RepID=UPI0007A87B86|nr:aspartate aminotransferase family protein [Flavihumibacter sp. CACIAM 22H1]KYP15530.1 MAG: aminotransferase class III [Flavihumibacter sp. CACIAM 22H1]
MNQRQLFLQHIAQTSPAPLALEIIKAKGALLTDRQGKTYIDLIAGISVCNVGHCHPKVVKAIRKQAGEYLHVLVYGELVETPQVAYASYLAEHLPASLNSVYFTNSGAEATEGAMKLAKRVTGRTRIIAFNQSYHGSTQGALSLIGDEYWRNAYRPLLPDILHLNYNDAAVLEEINHLTACVILETVQAEKGVHAPDPAWLQQVQQRCKETGTLLIMDEIQTGFGRTGYLWGFQAYGVVPDILLLGKALGGGMPLGAFVADKALMDHFTLNPVLGHITTFGGHPVSCAAGLAAMKVLIKEKWIQQVPEKEALFRELLQHPAITNLRAAGLLIAVEFESFAVNKQVIDYCIEKALLTDWFLFGANCLRIAPPLSISKKEIRKACRIILDAIDAQGL